MIEVPRATTPAGDGVLLIDKPAACTSHDVVAAVRRLAGTRKVGHAGTLDPAATGLLVLGIGAGTKLLTFFSGLDKDYSSTFRIGQATDTEDGEGQITESPGFRGSDEDIDGALSSLTGNIQQVPSLYSAKKINGKKAYELAREGHHVELKAVDVTISKLERTGEITPRDINGAPVADFPVDVSCSSGTFIRALARQTGQALGTAGHITSLRRTRIGNWSIAEALTIEQAIDAVGTGPLPLMSMAEAASRVMPCVEISERDATSLRYGQFINVNAPSFPVALVHEGTLVAIGKKRSDQVGPQVVFAHEL